MIGGFKFLTRDQHAQAEALFGSLSPKKVGRRSLARSVSSLPSTNGPRTRVAGHVRTGTHFPVSAVSQWVDATLKSNLTCIENKG